MDLRIKLLPSGRVIEAKPGRRLGDVLVEAGIPISLYCGRRGVCGKCFVEIVDGPLPPLEERERRLLEIKGHADRFRLACRLELSADLGVRVPEEALLPRMPVLSRGPERILTLDPAVRKIVVRPTPPDLGSPESRLDALRRAVGSLGLCAAAGTLRRSASVLGSRAEGPVTAVVYAGDEILAVEAGDTSNRLFGLALDVGTTTLAIELVDLVSGAVLGQAVGLNGQASFGADVVSRITASQGSPERLEALRQALLDSLNGIIDGILTDLCVRADEIYEAVVAGNTAMSHFFLGLSVDGLAEAPFAALFSTLPALEAGTTGLRMNPAGRVYLAPNIKSFVGGDITAGLIALDLPSLGRNVLFLDLGTNGEIVLKKGARLTAASTAAGPAFEGMTISCGLPARPGAIAKAGLDDSGALVLETVSGAPPLGICGSGLIDLAAAFLASGRLTAGGHIVDPSKRLPVTEGLTLTQGDIRELQLAAAAIKSGLRLVLEANDLAFGELDAMYIAGAFGTSLDVDNAVRIGLLPRLAAGRIVFVGNASLAGARALLLVRPERRRAERLARSVRHLSLALGGSFERTFVEALEFKPWPELEKEARS